MISNVLFVAQVKPAGMGVVGLRDIGLGAQDNCETPVLGWLVCWCASSTRYSLHSDIGILASETQREHIQGRFKFPITKN